jgi:hypothetical protein
MGVAVLDMPLLASAGTGHRRGAAHPVGAELLAPRSLTAWLTLCPHGFTRAACRLPPPSGRLRVGHHRGRPGLSQSTRCCARTAAPPLDGR